MDTFNLRKFLKENKVKEPINEETLKGAIEKEMEANAGRFETPFPTRDLRQILNTKNPEDLPSSAKKVLDKLKKKYKIKEATILNPEDLPEDEIEDSFGNKIRVREFDDESIEQYGDAMKQALGAAEAPPHITALAIAAEDAYEEMGNVDEVLKFVEMHLKGAYGD